MLNDEYCVQAPTVTVSLDTEVDYSELTKDDIEFVMVRVLLIMGLLGFVAAGAAYVDSKFNRRNDLFNVSSIFIFVFYIADFISGMYFLIL